MSSSTLRIRGLNPLFQFTDLSPSPSPEGLTSPPDQEITMQVHPFTESGLGFGPFRCTGYHDHGKAGAVPCQHCGQGLRYEFLITSRDGREFGVGSECVQKTGDAGLQREVEAEQIKLNLALKEQRRLERQAKRQAEWEQTMAEVMPSGKTRKEEMVEAAEKREREIRERQERVRSVWAPVLHALKATNGDFARDWAEALEGGENWPRGRALDICLEITAKKAGRKGSKAFNAEWDRVVDILEEGMAALDPEFQI
jgi:hypothetical protein